MPPPCRILFVRVPALFLLLPLIALPTAFAQTAPTDLDKVLQEGTRAYETRDFTKAVRLFTDVLTRAAPGSQLEPVAFFQAAALVESGEAERAIRTLAEFPKKYPGSPRLKSASILLARAYAMTGKTDQALGLLRPLENDPELRAEVLRAQIIALRAAGRADEAAAVQQRLLPSRRALTRPEALVAQQLLATQLNESGGDLDTARQTLLALWASGSAVDNLAALNTASLVLGGRFLAANRPEDALLLFQSTRPRDEVLAAQRRRVDELADALRTVVAGSAAGESNKAELEARLTSAKDALARLADTADFDRQVLLRLGFAYLALNRPWEATLVFRTGRERHDATPEAPLFLYGLVCARQSARRPAEAVALGREFFSKHPSAPERLDVALAAGGAALESGDIAAAIGFFSAVTKDAPAAAGDAKAEAALLQLGHAYFAAGNWAAAASSYDRFRKTFPKSERTEDVDYRAALTVMFSGDIDAARKQLEAYLKAYPQAKYEPDARYRLAVCAYGRRDWTDALGLVADWERRFGDNPQLGDVLAVRGDVLRSTGKPLEAVESYRLAARSAGNDQVLAYALNEAATLLEQQRDWPGVAALYQETLSARSGHPASLGWMNGIAKARARLGQFDEAAASLVAFARADVPRIDNEAVEETLSLIARIAARIPAEPAGETAPPAPPAWKDELFANDSSLIVQARRLYFESEVLRLRKRPADADELLLRLGRQFKPSELSAPLLAVAGETLLAAGETAAASSHFDALLARYPASAFRDIAMTGLGETALRAGDASRALGWARDAVKSGGSHREKEAVLLEGRALLALDRLDEAEPLFTRVASTKEWRGEATARSLCLLGEVAEKRGDLPKAIALYQRVFLSHQRYSEWVARAYLASAADFRKLGRKDEAAATLREMLRNARLADRPELAEARTRLAELDTP